MRILAIGDVVGKPGSEFFRAKIGGIREEYQIDMVIVNGENSAEGNGITTPSAKFLFASGADVITTGNHALRRRECYDIYERRDGVIRPANLHPDAPGAGWFLFDAFPRPVAVINLLGQVYLDPVESPFDCVDRLLEQIDTPIVLVDFHAEATAEKIAMAYHLDGRVSAVFGTHTHVQTADERIFSGGTGYITDLGMTGPIDSVLGVKPEIALYKMRTHLPVRFENGTDPCKLCGAIFEIDEKSGKTTKIIRLNIK
ncbi:TIGR00282 family metallophosphoesterase [Zongyangia hominis]|uniref:TIGR00282 family metallophosphoesterase n=1 Tax=Zongyangia hominis TaxID=2763677 RepID=A0A926ED24_9FIRM|nr:TIGR00282 family metallophosphoesterase [Zongyangia hominis]MBC8570833.1 TIGR00282 family metallophosphoesterase [Zongyangia hominis]